jgi:hypothetical protein
MFVLAVAWFAERFTNFCKRCGQSEEHDGRKHDGGTCSKIEVVAEQ